MLRSRLSKSTALFVLIFSIGLIISHQAHSQVQGPNLNSTTVDAEMAVQRAKILSNVAQMNNSLTDVIDCYWTIAQDLELDQLPGMQESHDLAVFTIDRVESAFSEILDIVDGIDYTVGPIEVDFGIAKWASRFWDDEGDNNITFGPWTVTAGAIPFFADLTDFLNDLIGKWASVACEVQTAVSNGTLQASTESNPDDFIPAEYGCWREKTLPYIVTRVWVNVVGLADLVNFTADDVAEEDIVAVGGGNLSLVHAPISVVVSLAKLVAANVKSCDDNVVSSEAHASYLRLAALHQEHLYSDSVFSEYWAYDLRTRIEINLAGHGNHPHAIASFQLPESMGGHLEMANEVVKETIQSFGTAGEQIGNADLRYLQGMNAQSAGEYKLAYDYFGQAYRAATKLYGRGNGDENSINIEAGH